MKNLVIKLLMLVAGCSLVCPVMLFGGTVDRHNMMKEFAKRMRDEVAVKATDDFSLSGCEMFNDENDRKTYLLVSVDKTADSACEVQSVFVFNTFGEGVELQKEATYGEQSENRSSRIALWSTELIAGGSYTPYVYWSTGKKGGIIRLPPQSLSHPDLSRMRTWSQTNDGKGEQLTAYIRICGNLRVKDAVENLVELINKGDRQTTEACLVAIAKINLPDEKLLELLHERKVKNVNTLISELGRLSKAFREDAAIVDLLEVGAIENDEAKTSVVLRLAYRGEKDLIGRIPLAMSWNRLMRFKVAVSALADFRKQKKADVMPRNESERETR